MHTAPRKAFSLVELLVAIGLVLVLLSLAVPALSRSRAAGREAGSLSNIRQLGALTVAYAADFRDYPPTIFRPRESYYWMNDDEEVVVRGRTVRGHWFDNANYFYAAFDELPTAKVLCDPAAPVQELPPGRGPMCHYTLAWCLYATPEFWDRWTQRGASQFQAQRLSDIVFPSEKGLMAQGLTFNVPGYPRGYPSCCVSGVRSVVLWADSSAGYHDQSSLLAGEPNFYHPGMITPPSYWHTGTPIHATKHGVRGRDKPRGGEVGGGATAPAGPDEL